MRPLDSGFFAKKDRLASLSSFVSDVGYLHKL